MADNRNIQEPLPDLNDPRQRHESRDVNVWAIGKVGLGLVLTTIASIGIVLGVFHFLQVEYHAVPGPQEQGIGTDARQLPPDPRLLPNEPQNLEQVRAAEEQIATTYRWSDENHTHVSVPIDRAIDMLVAKGLPSSNQDIGGAPSGVTVPTASGLGPKMQQPGGPLAGELAGSPQPPASQEPAAKGK
jgi:hypothetical protein